MPTTSVSLFTLSGSSTGNIWNLHGPVAYSAQNLVANIYKQTYIVSGANNNVTAVPASAQCINRADNCVGSSPVLIKNSTIAIVAEDELLVRAIDTSSGQVLWSSSLNAPNVSGLYHALSPLVSKNGETVCVTYTSWNALLIGSIPSLLRCLNVSTGEVTLIDSEPTINTAPSATSKMAMFAGTKTGWHSVSLGKNFALADPSPAAAPILISESKNVGYLLQSNCIVVVFNLTDGTVVQTDDISFDCGDLSSGQWPYSTDMPLLATAPGATEGTERLFVGLGNRVVALNIDETGRLSRFWAQKVSSCGLGVPLATDQFAVYFVSCGGSPSSRGFYFQSLPLNGPNNGLALALILGIGIPLLLVAIAIIVVLWKRFSARNYQTIE
jgi:outer membrane protein assembly factor BamB